MKQLLENPWEHLVERYPAGHRSSKAAFAT